MILRSLWRTRLGKFRHRKSPVPVLTRGADELAQAAISTSITASASTRHRRLGISSPSGDFSTLPQLPRVNLYSNSVPFGNVSCAVNRPESDRFIRKALGCHGPSAETLPAIKSSVSAGVPSGTPTDQVRVASFVVCPTAAAAPKVRRTGIRLNRNRGMGKGWNRGIWESRCRGGRIITANPRSFSPEAGRRDECRGSR